MSTNTLPAPANNRRDVRLPRDRKVQPPFFILALPRSRTKWLSVALTTERSTCLHEAWWGCWTAQRFYDRLSSVRTPIVGNSGCINALMLDKLLARWQFCRLVVVDRDTASVRESLRRIGWSDSYLNAIRTGMERACALPGTLRVRYEDLSNPDTGAAIWAHTIGEGFDADWWKAISEEHIVVNVEREQDRALRGLTSWRALSGGGTWEL